MKCRICPREISTERRQLQPRAVTCSPECSIEQHTKNIRAASAKPVHEAQASSRERIARIFNDSLDALVIRGYCIGMIKMYHGTDRVTDPNALELRWIEL